MSFFFFSPLRSLSLSFSRSNENCCGRSFWIQGKYRTLFSAASHSSLSSQNHKFNLKKIKKKEVNSLELLEIVQMNAVTSGTLVA